MKEEKRKELKCKKRNYKRKDKNKQPVANKNFLAKKLYFKKALILKAIILIIMKIQKGAAFLKRIDFKSKV